MAIDVRFGILRMRLSVDGVDLPLIREAKGWTRIGRRGRVRYHGFSDRTEIEVSEGRTEIRSGLRAMSFQWRGRRYRVGTMLLGRVHVEENGRLAMAGSMGVRGLRIDRFSPELAPIACELALGLAHHAESLWLAFATAH